MNTEEFKLIEGFEYAISTFGNVENLLTNKIITPYKNAKGHSMVRLTRNKQRLNFYVYQLVATAFIDYSKGKRFIQHIDNNKLNNNVNNLLYTIPHNIANIGDVTFNDVVNKWHSFLTVNDEHIELGYFDTIEQAKQARRYKTLELYNFIN